MTDKLSPQRRSENIARHPLKRHGAGDRRAANRARAGLPLQASPKDLPGTPDLVFAGRKKVIFVHGCFWHQHTDPACKIARLPKSNLDYWLPKLEPNVTRDAQHTAELEVKGWQVLTVRECETKDVSLLQDKLGRFLGP